VYAFQRRWVVFRSFLQFDNGASFRPLQSLLLNIYRNGEYKKQIRYAVRVRVLEFEYTRIF